MIVPKVQRPTARQEREAYEIATFRDDDTCQRCLRNCGPTARDHRQNRQSGNTVASNLQVLGLRCHTWKTEHPRAAVTEGWAVPSWASPAGWPARRWVPQGAVMRCVWVLYDDDGDWVQISDREAERRMEGGTAWPTRTGSTPN